MKKQKANLFTMSVPAMRERLVVTAPELALIKSCVQARVIPTLEIQKFDFYKRLLKELLEEIHLSEEKMRILTTDYQLQLPGEITEIIKSKKTPKLTLKMYKKRNKIMEKIIPIYQDILECEEEKYGKANLERILYSIWCAFEKGASYIALFYKDTSLDFEKIYEAVKNAPASEYYMFSGNMLDIDEYMTFGIMYGYHFSGVVITKDCPVETIKKLVSEYFKHKDVFDVFILTA